MCVNMFVCFYMRVYIYYIDEIIPRRGFFEGTIERKASGKVIVE